MLSELLWGFLLETGLARFADLAALALLFLFFMGSTSGSLVFAHAALRSGARAGFGRRGDFLRVLGFFFRRFPCAPNIYKTIEEIEPKRGAQSSGESSQSPTDKMTPEEIEQSAEKAQLRKMWL